MEKHAMEYAFPMHLSSLPQSPLDKFSSTISGASHLLLENHSIKTSFLWATPRDAQGSLPIVSGDQTVLGTMLAKPVLWGPFSCFPGSVSKFPSQDSI